MPWIRAWTLDGSTLGLPHSIVLAPRAKDNHALASAFVQDAKAKGLSPIEKNELAREVASSLGQDCEQILAMRQLQLMNPDEVRETARAGMDIQLHTHRHQTPLDKALFVREIEDNRAWIRRELGVECTHFCYPSGGYRRAMLPWLRELGIESATTCDHALATLHDDPLLLPRLLDSMSISETELYGWLSGVSSLLPHRRVNVPYLAWLRER